MHNNLSVLFPSIQLLSERPVESSEKVYVFHNNYTGNWMKIDQTEVSEREYALLSSLFSEIKPNPSANHSVSEKWFKFLFENGSAPFEEETEIRVIQLHFKMDHGKNSDLEEAVKAFFDDSIQLVFISAQNAILIEQRSSYIQTPEDFYSFINTLESDFYIKLKLYIGKFHLTDRHFPIHFSTEKEWFLKGISRNRAIRIYTMENTFPFSLVDQMSDEMKHIIRKEILNPIQYDQELLQTMQLLFENGFNATVTAKKLHVHRNTLQYRLTKFQDITGISVRNFDGALVAYCASLIAIEG
ncbi:helix-turn-helix domain-containing protein [Filibacter tadaridae]|uniref:Leucine-rich protein n=1 Tax=Filibacter tadaridae TaxID=2483811 RepID=A0A3P5WTT9_9BACL|nr:helix-turn-helix domain-containing protein [Filibacter tadaridae]VDC25085.1 Leucine-rich protein [Filibacter tadaridae]